jgi:hypothetical protein
MVKVGKIWAHIHASLFKDYSITISFHFYKEKPSINHRSAGAKKRFT